MSQSEISAKMLDFEKKISARYRWFFRQFFFISIILISLVVIAAIGIVYLGLGTNWFLFNFEGWIFGVLLAIGLFVLLEILFFLHFFFYRRKRLRLEQPQPEYIDGKIIIDITFPKGIDGGVFSKTYIEIDNNSILRLRNLMIPPDEIL
jgi:hypothetical protein